jgi:hypothetical protein
MENTMRTLLLLLAAALTAAPIGLRAQDLQPPAAHQGEFGEKVHNRTALIQVAPVPPAPPMPPMPPMPHAQPVSPTLFPMDPLGRQDKQLSTDDARRIVDGALAFKGNKRLKAGNAEADGDGAARVEVVTLDNSLVDTIRVNRRTGALDKVP